MRLWAARQQRLLLIAPRQKPDWCIEIGQPDIERLDIALRDFLDPGAGQRSEPALPRLQGQDDILAYRQITHNAFGLAILRAERKAMPDGRAGIRDLQWRAAQLGCAPIRGLSAKDRIAGLAASRAQKPGKPDHLAFEQQPGVRAANRLRTQ